MRLTIDRFEGEFAVVELPDRSQVNFPVILLPSEAQEGDVIEITINSTISRERKKEISRLMDKIWE